MGDRRISKAELDCAFFEILKALNAEVKETAGLASQKIIELSSEFLNESARRAVEDFHALYFATKENALTRKVEEVNREVDKLFSDIKEQVASGKSEQEIKNSLGEQSAVKKARLSISGVQKELEMLIRLDAGIREKLIPVLSSVQFEDMMNQRLTHIEDAWGLIIKELGNNPSDTKVAEVSEKITGLMTSAKEKETYFHTVLKKDPPPAAEEGGMFMFDLLGKGK